MIYTQEDKFPYPNITLLKPLSRSYFKLIEMLKVIDFFKDLPKEIQHIRSSHVAEGPGGFIQAFVDMVENNKRKIKKIDTITLRSDKQFIPGWKKASFFLKKYSNIINISYGKDGTGDIYIEENRNYFINEVVQKSHLFTADGGFDFSIDYSQQEKQIFKLLVCSFIIGLQTLALNGACIIKLFDTYSPSTQTLLSLCGNCFKEYTIYKPVTSRPCNSERYFIGRKYKGMNTKIIVLLNAFIKNIEENKYPNSTLTNEELEFIENISNIYEKQQIDCINLAKQFAEDLEDHKKYYDLYYKISYKFCEEYNIPIKSSISKI
jgi:23S rRNA U2552 (ribose-2'-O)-methylase RlmE/FtsJ